MKHRLYLLVLFASLLLCRSVRAQAPLGSVAATFTYTASKVLADPARTRVYVTDTTSNSVVVIDTTTLKVAATVPIGSNPVDMAISPDGSTLYVANGGSTLSAIALLDLNTLAVRGTFSLATAPVAIAAGLGGRLYVAASPDGFSTTIYQLNGTTGAVQTTFNSGYYDNNLLTLSVDKKTLYEANNEDEPGDLKSFDVSTATPVAAQVHSFFSTFPPELIVSHNGKYLCLPSYSSVTYLYATADITTYYGSFSSQEDSGAGPLAFSPDDSLVYEAVGSYLDVFSTTSFTEVSHALLPSASGSNGYPYTVKQLVIDNTGSYLFIGGTSYNGNATVGQLSVITTGAGTLTPPSIVPVITSATTANATQGAAFSYQITAANTPTSFNATSLPSGVTVNTTTGLISGTPTSSGYYYVTLNAANASGTATASLTLNVAYSSASYIPVITTSSLANGAVGQSYSQTVTATNGAYYYGATVLPAGLSINSSTGVISGVPTTAGTSTVTLSATNGYGTATAKLSLTVTTALPVITSGTAAGAVTGTPFTYQIAATNTPNSFAAAGLPGGLSANTATGLISGTPTATGTFSVTLSATNSSGIGTARLTITVTAPVPVISSPTTGAAQLGQPFAYQIAATNSPKSYAATGLPAGVTVNTLTGLISGTPLASGTFPVTLSATNTGGTGTLALSLTVNVAVPAITGVLSANATQGQPFFYQITANSAPTGYAATGLPDGLTLDPNTGLISGAPTQVGEAAVTLSVLNAAGTGTATLTLTVRPFAPVVTLVATRPTVTAGSGEIGEFILSLSSAAADDVVVNLTIKGTAANGTDYTLLKSTAKIKAGKTVKPIKITPQGDLSGITKKVVTLSLAPGDGYTVGATAKAKVKIIAP